MSVPIVRESASIPGLKALKTGGAVTQTIRRIHLPQKLRNLELSLILLALLLSVGAVALVQLGAVGEVRIPALLFIASAWVPVVILHIVLRRIARDADPFLLPIASLLNGIGVAMIYRIDIANDTLEGWGATFIRQVVWEIIAVLAAIATVWIIRNHRVLLRYTYVAGLLAVVLLLSPLLPIIGKDVSGARVWLSLGVASFQPAEIAKIALAVFFAGYLVRNRDSLSTVGKRFIGIQFPRLRDLGPIIVIWLLAMAIIIFERDLGTGLLLFGLFLVMLYVATARLSWVIIGCLMIGGGAFFASRTLEYVGSRFGNWLAPFSDARINAPSGDSYQVIQGLFGLANGGLLGTGLGLGRPEITPLSQSDYIIASLGEELGLAGIFAIVLLYMFFTARGMRIGFAGQDDFGKLLASGMAFVMALQVFIVIGGVTRVLPLTGLTTPFLAAGGSSLVANWIIVALLLRLSDTVRNKPRLVIES